MVHVALRVAYDGTRFHGSQVQPGVRTVHSELVRAFSRINIEDPQVRWSGRTDAGVSALGNVAVVDMGDRPVGPELLPALTHQMEDAWVWGLAEVPADFQPRRARRRRYRYHLASDVEAKAMEEALGVFVGTHDFRAFARVEPGVTPTRRVDAVLARRRGALLLLDVEGESFLYNQVRRMVAAALQVARGTLTRKDVEDALANGEPGDFGIAPPEPLVLMSVEYDGIQFRTGEPDVLSRVRRRLEPRVDEARVRAEVMTMFSQALGGMG